MFYSVLISAEITRELPEEELDTLAADLWSLKENCRVVGKVLGRPNYIFNIYNETDFNEVSNKFCGRLSIYAETDTRDGFPVDTACAIFGKYECKITSVVRKLKL